MSELEHLREVMDRLRSPGGCPWDIEQTHQSILKYLIEECYEFIDAVNENDREAMQEELGDILLQVFFHSRIAEENVQPFSVEEVAGKVAKKLTDRHPHVFAGTQVANSDEVLTNWEKAKQKEKGRTSPFEGVPQSQPALALAAKALYRLEKLEYSGEVKLGDSHTSNILGEVDNILKNSKKQSSMLSKEKTSEILGEILFQVVQKAIELGVEPESALRGATIRFMNSIEKDIEEKIKN